MNFFKIFRNENDQEALIDAEAQSSRGNRSSFKDFSLSEFEFSFESIHENIPNFSNFESLKVTDCPKFESALETIPLLLRFNSALCLHFIIDDFIENLTPTLGFFKMFDSANNFSNSFVFIFEKKTDNSSLIYWRVKDSPQIFSLLSMKNSARFSDFFKRFLANCLKNGHNGISSIFHDYLKNKIQVTIKLTSLADPEGLNLLHLAARDGKLELVHFLLNFIGMNYEVKGKIAIDFAYEKNHFDVVHLLLEENSRFPRDFKFSTSMPDKLKNFAEMSQKLHESIKRKDETVVKEILDENSTLKFFFDSQSRSALNVALTSGAFDVYKLLMAKNFTFGPHEIFKDLLKKLSKSQRKKLTEINESMYKCVEAKHILMLMSNTQVGPDDKQARLGAVYNALQKLNKVPGIKILLQIVAATRNFQLIFDFNYDHIHFLQPAQEGYITGLFDYCGRLYIGAKHLLNPSRAHEVLGVIAHELCHFVMWTVFKNDAKPYDVNDKEKRERFEQILGHCKENKDREKIITLVFNEYEDHMHVAELIVRAPHALGLYIDQPEKLEEFKENFAELDNFYGESFETMKEKLPKIEEEAENRIRKESSSPLNFVKYHWKKILLGLFLMTLAAFSITILARSCLVKNCGDLRAFCVFEKFKAVCKCPQNATENLYWDDNKCNQCLIDEHCNANQTCFVNNCHNSRNVFTCDKKSKRMFSSSRCDGKFDCDDGTDETYHCIYGKLKNRRRFILKTLIKSEDFLIFMNGTADNCEEFNIYNGEDRIYLPVNISKSFPKLVSFDGFGYIRKISVENFWGLDRLEYLNLQADNLIDDDVFRDLRSLARLNFILLSVTPISLSKRLLANLKDLQALWIGGEGIESLDDGFFDNNLQLQELKITQTSVKSLQENAFEKLKELRNLSLELNYFNQMEPNTFYHLHKIETLHLEDNYVLRLTSPLFSNCSNVREIVCKSTSRLLINEITFKGCMSVTYLDLSNNSLIKLPKLVFVDLVMLEKLNLKENKIKSLDENIFENNVNLKFLDLSKNNLQVLQENLFKNSVNLLVLHFSENKLTSLSSALISRNKQIIRIIFNTNLIEKIEEHFIDELKNLTFLDLRRNLCINRKYGSSYSKKILSQREREYFKKEVKLKCKNATNIT